MAKTGRTGRLLADPGPVKRSRTKAMLFLAEISRILVFLAGTGKHLHPREHRRRSERKKGHGATRKENEEAFPLCVVCRNRRHTPSGRAASS